VLVENNRSHGAQREPAQRPVVVELRGAMRGGALALGGGSRTPSFSATASASTGASVVVVAFVLVVVVDVVDGVDVVLVGGEEKQQVVESCWRLRRRRALTVGPLEGLQCSRVRLQRGVELSELLVSAAEHVLRLPAPRVPGRVALHLSALSGATTARDGGVLAW
jgi:hypothetical protein